MFDTRLLAEQGFLNRKTRQSHLGRLGWMGPMGAPERLISGTAAPQTPVSSPVSARPAPSQPSAYGARSLAHRARRQPEPG